MIKGSSWSGHNGVVCRTCANMEAARGTPRGNTASSLDRGTAPASQCFCLYPSLEDMLGVDGGRDMCQWNILRRLTTPYHSRLFRNHYNLTLTLLFYIQLN